MRISSDTRAIQLWKSEKIDLWFFIIVAGAHPKMKWSPGALFCEQVGELTRVFSQWNECEQTVVLYALLRRIPAVQARFLAQAVQHSLHSVSELDSQELNANNPSESWFYFLFELSLPVLEDLEFI